MITPICAEDSFGTGSWNTVVDLQKVVLGVILDAAAPLPEIALEALPRVAPGVVSIVK